MHHSRFVHMPPARSPALRAICIAAGIAAVSVAAYRSCGRYRRRHPVPPFAPMPGVESLFPALHTNADMLLKALGLPVQTMCHSNKSPRD